MARLLEDRRILVVEDEFLAALDMAEAVERHGGRVVGPVGRLGQAMELARSEALDAAILDVRLDGETSFPLADLLAERGVPMLFATGYDHAHLPERFDAARRIAKPVSDAALEGALRALFRSA